MRIPQLALSHRALAGGSTHPLRGAGQFPLRATSDISEVDIITTRDLQRAAKRLNVELREEVSGPWYQMKLFSDGREVGKTSGWAQPWGIMHLETIEVRRFTGYWVQKEGYGDQTAENEGEEKKTKYADVSKIARWFGLLLAVSIACWNRERSPFRCKEAHLLAIKDEEKQHKRLVRYYRGLGFQTLREPEDLTIPDQIFWGGEGTLMSVTEDDFMRRWAPVVRELGGTMMRKPKPAA